MGQGIRPVESTVTQSAPDEPRKRYEGTGTKFSGTEPIFGGFTNSSTIISNIRLTHGGQIFASVVDLGAAIVTLAREYKFHGDPVRAYQDIIRIRSSFDGRVQQWKNEEMSRLQAKRAMNGNQLRELEKELNRVRLEIARGESTLNKLQNDLDLISRVGDECPLLKPQEGTGGFDDTEYVVPVLKKKKKSNKALLSLARFVQPNGMRLAFEDARFEDDFDDAIREHLYDQKTHLSIIAHWSDRNPFTRERGNIYLHLLLIPKSVEALDSLPSIVENHSFLVSADNVSVEAEFDLSCISQEKMLVEKKLMNYLHDVEAGSFQHKDLVVKRQFEFFAADVCPDIAFDDGSKMEFRLKVKKKDS